MLNYNINKLQELQQTLNYEDIIKVDGTPVYKQKKDMVHYKDYPFISKVMRHPMHDDYMKPSNIVLNIEMPT